MDGIKTCNKIRFLHQENWKILMSHFWLYKEENCLLFWIHVLILFIVIFNNKRTSSYRQIITIPSLKKNSIFWRKKNANTKKFYFSVKKIFFRTKKKIYIKDETKKKNILHNETKKKIFSHTSSQAKKK